MLPEDCVSVILSLTSPLHACRSSLVSSTFRSAAESDIVWERFLPSDYRDIVLRSSTADLDHFSSKKELFLYLCSNPILLDRKSFKLDKSSGKKSYILSARELSITLSDNPEYWSWKSTPESRFPEVAELRTIRRLEIEGKIRTRMLSPNTSYAAFLLIKVTNCSYGLDSIPAETSLKMGNLVSTTNTAYLSYKDSKKRQMESLFYGNRKQMLKARVAKGDGRVPVERDEDGWMEIELGEFFSGEDDEEVKMGLREVNGYQLKGGFLVEGIEVRPK
ncbi:F-box protein PP2-B15-like [Melia azedarach]|uniref:F-box protein PP2-B15-like n=1 Tax=Melia azedarach TaxID=155640 RepID=A0ACC1Y758_MELAZ|nr:F-box protein PP2-B15-like [Melia azedarach]